MSWLHGKFYDHAPRWCSCCLTKQPVKGGEYQKIDNNRQQWVCGFCSTRQKEKDAELNGAV